VYIDTHVHLDLDQFPDVGEVIQSSMGVGVVGFINIGFNPVRWRSTLDLANRYPQVAYTLGFHPGSSHTFNDVTAAELSDLISSTIPVGIGEAGIDLFHSSNPPLDVQMRAFAHQIDLAVANDLPLVIHQRNAEDHVREQLESAPAALRVILHSFEGSRQLLDLAVQRGWFIGIGGLMTRRSSPVRTILESVPLDRFVLETDSPYLVPAGLKERRNTPENIPVIADRLAGLLGVSADTIVEAGWRNAFAAFPRLAPALNRQAVSS
jgi:TatD DNase family protein